LRAFLSVGVEASTQTLLQKGRPFILRRVTGDLKWHFTSPINALIRWDEKAGLQRDAIRSQ